ncbi:Hint domain-containing protein [Acetobacter senegalensis]|uniref:Hint domain-containing protein n=1 Tax=Acetobacter senegalensis TaxID=446692 RepID=UPI001EDBDF9E
MTVKWSAGGQNTDWWNRDNWDDTFGGQWINGVYVSHYVPQDINYAFVQLVGTEENPVTVDYDASKSQEASNQVGNLEIGDNATLNVFGVQQSGQYAFNVNYLTIDQGGELDIDTTSQVFLGSNPVVYGLLKISNASVLIDSHSVVGNGTVILDNASLGSTSSYMALDCNLTTVLENGSTLYINNASAGKKIEVDDTKNYIVLQDYNQTVTTEISGYNDNTVIRIEAGSQTPISGSWQSNGDGTYTIFIAFDNYGNGITFTDVVLDKDPVFTIGEFKITQNSDGSWDVIDPTTTDGTAVTFSATDEAITCYLAGSMVRTLNGDIAVENIQIGEKIVAFDWKNNRDIIRPVVWVGKGHVKVNPALPDDEAGWPVRVLKNAIADGVPCKDMLITSEHCLFFQDKFVPVRMLVNGVSVFYDKSFPVYDYYHVETEPHSVITVDGMLTESYLDTGNRSSFRQNGKIAILRGKTHSWEQDSAAPLDVERSFVEPLFQRIKARESITSACCVQKERIMESDESDLHLVTEKGACIRPIRREGQYYRFMLPPGIKAVRLVSRTNRPCDVIGPFVDDRRPMGVAVAEVHLLVLKHAYKITAHLQATKPEGWYADMGEQGVAWTNGDAMLPLGDYLTERKMGLLSIRLHAAGPYQIRPQPETGGKARII